MITRISTLLLAAALLSGSVQAADYAPLAPGKPSGVVHAQEARQTVLLVGGALLVTAGFAFLIAATQNDKSTPLSISGGNPALAGGNTTTTTTTTS